jgi:hypothetical protein
MIELTVTKEMIESCKQKAESIGKLKNSITKGEGNLSGVLGEYLTHKQLTKSIWKNTFNYDLIEYGVRIDVKTKRCTSAPQDFYDCSIAETSLHQHCDEYVFVRILNDMSKAWLLGRMDHKEYFKKARFMAKGEVDLNNNFTVKANCYNLQIKELHDMFNIHTALKQLDVTLKQVKKTRAQLPKLNREKVDQELKILLLDLQLLQQDLKYIRDHGEKETQNN